MATSGEKTWPRMGRNRWPLTDSRRVVAVLYTAAAPSPRITGLRTEQAREYGLEVILDLGVLRAEAQGSSSRDQKHCKQVWRKCESFWSLGSHPTPCHGGSHPEATIKSRGSDTAG